MQDTFLIIHFLGLALGVGTGFSMLRLARATHDLPVAERMQVMKHASSLSKNSSIGLTLLIVSGLCMLFTRGVGTVFASGGMPFHIKLTLVLILTGLFGYSQVLMKRAREKQDLKAAAALQKVGPAMLFTGIAIVICAVLAFH